MKKSDRITLAMLLWFEGYVEKCPTCDGTGIFDEALNLTCRDCEGYGEVEKGSK